LFNACQLTIIFCVGQQKVKVQSTITTLPAAVEVTTSSDFPRVRIQVTKFSTRFESDNLPIHCRTTEHLRRNSWNQTNSERRFSGLNGNWDGLG